MRKLWFWASQVQANKRVSKYFLVKWDLSMKNKDHCSYEYKVQKPRKTSRMNHLVHGPSALTSWNHRCVVVEAQKRETSYFSPPNCRVFPLVQASSPSTTKRNLDRTPILLYMSILISVGLMLGWREIRSFMTEAIQRDLAYLWFFDALERLQVWLQHNFLMVKLLEPLSIEACTAQTYTL